MLRLPRHLWSSHRALEPFLIAACLLVTAIVALNPRVPLLLSLYYLPVTVAAFYLGQLRGGVLAGLSVITAAGVWLWAPSAAGAEPVRVVDLLAFLVWAATLGLTAIVTGGACDAWRHAMDKLAASHRSAALTDSLTEVANRRGFDLELAARMRDAENLGAPLALIFVDIDEFKKFNDSYGHHAGDRGLAGVSAALKRATRDTDTVARYGGEEFAVLISGAGTKEVMDLAERMRIAVQASRLACNELSLRLTVSVGAAQWTAGDQPEDLVQRADAALYASKEAGRNCAHFNDGENCLSFGAGITRPPQERGGANAADNELLDDPTGVLTLPAFLGELRRRLAEAERYGIDVCLAVITLDDYQAARGRGARAERELLTTAARITESALRAPDAIGRCSDDSLCVMLPWTDLADSMVALRRLCERAGEYKDPRSEAQSCRMSIGVSHHRCDIDRCDSSAFERAKQAAREASRAGGNRILAHDGAARPSDVEAGSCSSN